MNDLFLIKTVEALAVDMKQVPDEILLMSLSVDEQRKIYYQAVLDYMECNHNEKEYDKKHNMCVNIIDSINKSINDVKAELVKRCLTNILSKKYSSMIGNLLDE